MGPEYGNHCVPRASVFGFEFGLFRCYTRPHASLAGYYYRWHMVAALMHSNMTDFGDLHVAGASPPKPPNSGDVAADRTA